MKDVSIEEVSRPIKHENSLVDGILAEKHSFIENLNENLEVTPKMASDIMKVTRWGGALVAEGWGKGTLIGAARRLNTSETPLRLAGNFGTKHNSAIAFAHQHKAIAVVRSDDEHLKGISVFSNRALNLDPPECYHIVMPGQQNNAKELQEFRKLRYDVGAVDVSHCGLRHVGTLVYVKEYLPEKGIKIPGSIDRTAFKNVVETSLTVSGHEGVWCAGVFMILAEGARMEDLTMAKTDLLGVQMDTSSIMIQKFVEARHTFGSEEGVGVKLKAEITDIMGWGDMIVVDHTGLVVGIARVCVPGAESPLTVGDGFDTQYDEYLQFAHRNECVMVVRAESKAHGVCVFSHEALNQETPECHHLVAEEDEVDAFTKWLTNGKCMRTSSMRSIRRSTAGASSAEALANMVAREVSIAAEAESIRDKEAAIAAKEASIQEREAAMAEKEAALAAKEAALAAKEAKEETLATKPGRARANSGKIQPMPAGEAT